MSSSQLYKYKSTKKGGSVIGGVMKQINLGAAKNGIKARELKALFSLFWEGSEAGPFSGTITPHPSLFYFYDTRTIRYLFSSMSGSYSGPSLLTSQYSCIENFSL